MRSHTFVGAVLTGLGLMLPSAVRLAAQDTSRQAPSDTFEQRTGPRMSYIPPTSSGSTSRARSAVLTSFPKRSWISCSALV